MKWIESIKNRLNFIFRNKMKIPRKVSNRFEIEFSEINHILILSDDDGIPVYVIACGGDKNKNFYFEEYSADLMKMLGPANGDCRHIFSEINDSLKRGIDSEAILSTIKNLLK
ncbi:hypothetical protein [Burkholderia vietnamiensis]|uniref:hypothetical protein n=1 Tax=Burkholderia vietnamiensis TaxID=60552 RepID=UPI0012D9BD78|nr:hypothetical protein [Burkholderia vietnamiensis]